MPPRWVLRLCVYVFIRVYPSRVREVSFLPEVSVKKGEERMNKEGEFMHLAQVC